MIHKQKLLDNDNCLQVNEYECNDCQYGFLSADKPKGDMKCPSCGGGIEAHKTFVINRGTCTHNHDMHGHQYMQS